MKSVHQEEDAARVPQASSSSSSCTLRPWKLSLLAGKVEPRGLSSRANGSTLGH
jgi:hypothetical protein